MELLQAGIDRAVIALWLGHESAETTQIHLEADLALKERIFKQDLETTLFRARSDWSNRARKRGQT